MNGADIMRITAVQGLISQVLEKLGQLSTANEVQLRAKMEATNSLMDFLKGWEKKELFELQQAYEEVVR